MQPGPFVSIVIPAFNTERYIDECLRSIVEQTYARWQVLVVDDGSTDSTGQICDAWARADERIIVIHESNEGVSAARNKGADAAMGDLIWFIDADDRIVAFALEMIVNAYMQFESELIAIEVEPFREDGRLPSSCLGFGSLNRDGASDANELEMLLFRGERGHFPFSYVYAAGLLNRMRGARPLFHSDILLYEDAAFIHECLRLVSSVTWISTPLYMYRQVSGSALHNPNSKMAASGILAVQIIEALDVPDELRFDRMRMLIRFLLSIDTLAGEGMDSRLVRENARKELRMLLKSPDARDLSLRERFKIRLMLLGMLQPLRNALTRLHLVDPWEVA